MQNCKFVRFALGLHPLLADRHKGEYIKFRKNVEKTSYIGEVGLDFSKDGIHTKDKQIESFEFVLNEIKGKKKIVSLHSRKAESEVLYYLKKFGIKSAIFHWYSGTLTNIATIIKSGYFFSVNTAMVNSKSGQKIISKIPLNRLLTETDAPYTLFEGKATKPEDVKYVVQYLAQIYKKKEIEIVQMIYNNFQNLIDTIR